MVYERLGRMMIDEHGKESLGKDNKRLTLTFGRVTNTKHKRIASEFLGMNEKQITESTKNREENGGVSYNSLGI